MEFSGTNQEEKRFDLGDSNTAYNQAQNTQSQIFQGQENSCRINSEVSLPSVSNAEQNIGKGQDAMHGIPGSFDISNYDNLQDHAYQLSASAGYSSTSGSRKVVVPLISRQAQNSQQLQPQMYYYPSNGMQFGAGQAAVAEISQGQTMYTLPAGYAPIITTQGQQQQYYQVSTNDTHSRAFVRQVVTQPPENLASQSSVSTATTESTSGIKRPPSGIPTQESSVKRQFLVQMATPVVDSLSPQNVPSASSGFDFDDEVDPMQRPPPSNYATMSAEEKRRYERNLREQQRSFKISQQIKELRNVLAESNISFKPNKFSILLSVADYVKQLQSRAIMLDVEHRKLIETIRKTSEMVSSGQTPLSDDDNKGDQHISHIGVSDMIFVQGLDYKAIFQQCPAALGVAALDGRMLACNEEFASISGFSKECLLRLSLFNLMNNHEDVFRAMGEMLSNSCATAEAAKLSANPPPPIYWSGLVSQKNQNVSFGMECFESLELISLFCCSYS
jgi:PAS domain-containing protein